MSKYLSLFLWTVSHIAQRSALSIRYQLINQSINQIDRKTNKMLHSVLITNSDGIVLFSKYFDLDAAKDVDGNWHNTVH